MELSSTGDVADDLNQGLGGTLLQRGEKNEVCLAIFTVIGNKSRSQIRLSLIAIIQSQIVFVEMVRGRTKTPNAPSPYSALGKLYASSCRLGENHCGWLACYYQASRLLRLGIACVDYNCDQPSGIVLEIAIVVGSLQLNAIDRIE